MTKRIFHSTLAVGLAVLVTSLAVVLGCLYDYYVRLQEMCIRDRGGSVKFVDAVRFQTGEGIEKKQEDFAAEVAAQMNMGK